MTIVEFGYYGAHECNAYCRPRDGVHAVVGFCDTEPPADAEEAVREACGRIGRQLLSVSLAPEAPEYDALGEGPYPTRYLIVWQQPVAGEILA